MELKKSNKADLENKRIVFVEYGLVFVLAGLLLAFEWGSSLQENTLMNQIQNAVAEEEMIITRSTPPPPPPPPPAPQVIEVLNIVEDNVDIEEIDFESMEADENMSLELQVFEEQEQEAAEEEVFVIVEDMPRFKGGDLNEFRSWVAGNLRYPEIAAENGISGRVFVQFAVNGKGEVVDVNVVRGVDQALDSEAVRVIKSSPKWSPGKQRGRPVKVQFTFPVVFVLQ